MLESHPFLLGLACAVPASLILAFLLMRRAAAPRRKYLLALLDGINSLRDRDFSVSIASGGSGELTPVIEAHNALGQVLRDERQSLYQRELLLDTVIQSTPLALVLTNANGAIVYSNVAARRLLLGGRKLEGYSFNTILEDAPEAMREAIGAGQDTLFSMPIDEETQIFHLSLQRFVLNAQVHHLYLFKALTRELNAQEVLTWKKVIRVMSHELNNSLAPISSLAHSGQLLLERGESEPLQRVFKTIEERAAHLHSFVNGYAHFAKLPKPRLTETSWPQFFEVLRGAVQFTLQGQLPQSKAWLDTAQIEQVLINMIKNAHESGSPADEVCVQVIRRGAGFMLTIADRGSGMDEPVLQQALLPFYSTKPAGTGLGLTVSREIIEAHGGRLTLSNRDGGGLKVSLWLPAQE
jgi:nitrogen fixation/metabolism regulation signal transduction histidine kinase